MKVLRVMDSTGDSVIEFDETQANAKATKEAKALFERLTKDHTVFALGKGEGGTDAKVTNFDELAQENVVVPLIVGG